MASALVGGAAGLAAAKAPPELAVDVAAVGRAACPSPTRFEEALRQVLPGVSIRASARQRVLLEDRGSRYRVKIAGRVRDLRDPARRCDERARAAAVVVALALDLVPAPEPEPAPVEPPPLPPVEPAPVEPPPSPPPPPVAPPPPRPPAVVVPPAPPPSHHHVELSLSGLAALLPTAAPVFTVYGGQLRLSWRYRFLGVTVGAGYLSPHFYPIPLPVGPSVGASVQRWPFDIGPRAHFEWGRLQVALQATAVLSVAQVAQSGVPLDPQPPSTHLEVGIAPGFELRLALIRNLSIFLGISGVIPIRPLAPRVHLDPNADPPDGSDKQVEAAYPWLNVSVGLSWMIR